MGKLTEARLYKMTCLQIEWCSVVGCCGNSVHIIDCYWTRCRGSSTKSIWFSITTFWLNVVGIMKLSRIWTNRLISNSSLDSPFTALNWFCTELWSVEYCHWVFAVHPFIVGHSFISLLLLSRDKWWFKYS